MNNRGVFFERLSCAKVNLYLKVKDLRQDSYHNLETLFQEIDLADHISFEIIEDSLANVHVSCPAIDCAMEENLLYKAVRLFLDHFGFFFSVKAVIKKNIPIGSGLGGGSSNAATALKILADYKGINRFKLLHLAKKLGADVPFFLYGGLAWGTGRGDEITPIECTYDKKLLIIVPKICVSTAKVFQAFQEMKLEKNLTQKDFYDKNLSCFIEKITKKHQIFFGNNLESTAVLLYPLLARLKEVFVTNVFEKTLQMSGSGASFFMECPDSSEKQAVFTLCRQLSCDCFVSKVVFRSV